MSKKPYVCYVVFGFYRGDHSKVVDLGMTLAVSPAKAVNNRRWHHFGRTSPEDLFCQKGITMVAYPSDSKRVTEIRQKFWGAKRMPTINPNKVKPGQQTYFDF